MEGGRHDKNTNGEHHKGSRLEHIPGTYEARENVRTEGTDIAEYRGCGEQVQGGLKEAPHQAEQQDERDHRNGEPVSQRDGQQHHGRTPDQQHRWRVDEQQSGRRGPFERLARYPKPVGDGAADLEHHDEEQQWQPHRQYDSRRLAEQEVEIRETARVEDFHDPRPYVAGPTIEGEKDRAEEQHA